MHNNNDIAIVGMSCVFPGAGDVHAYWDNIKNKFNAISEVPEDRWEKVYYDPSSTAVDRFYCKRGGFINDFADFDPLEFGIVPITVEGTEPDHLLTLRMAKLALEDAGVFEKNRSLEKTGIILGKGNYMGTGITRLVEQMRTGEHLVNLLKSVAPDVSDAELDKIRKGFQKSTGRFGPDTAMGLIPNLAASLVANRLDLGGTAYTIDAACASSLIAIDHAVSELNSGRCDMVLAGGIHLCQNVTFYSVFTQLGALSRNQEIRPFDQNADGLLIGEGCGMVALKRLEDALKDKDHVYAVIKGVGVASDGGATSLMSPAVKGQSKAIEQAWNKAKVEREVGYIEAHGTATPLGDKTEIETLTKVFGGRNGTPLAGLGSVKSMIGHAMPAAGIAGLIKTTLALHHGQLPPTINCDNPLKAIDDSRFMTVNEVVDWDQTELPRRAGVNAFGFGGINAHVVLEGFNAPTNETGKKIYPVAKAELKKDEVLLLARNTAEELVHALENGEVEVGHGDHALALFEPTNERIEKAIKIVKRGKAWRNRNDIWYTPDPLLKDGGNLCFLFPGLDALEKSTIDSVCHYFDIPRLEHAESSDLVESGIKVFEASMILDKALKKLGVVPDMIAGHSLGEWIGCFSAGICDEKFVLKLLAQLDPHSITVPDVFFLVVGCSLETIKPIITGIEDVYLSHDNCPHQVILCGNIVGIEKCKELLNERKIFNQVLPFQSGFHSPFFEDHISQLRDKMDILNELPQIPLWSATTTGLYPNDIEGIRELSTEHLIKPVRFRELVAKLHDSEKANVFVQMGAGGLVGFADDTLKGKRYSALSASSPKRTGLNQLQRVVAALFVEGKEVDVNFLNLMKKKRRSHPMKLALGLPLVKEFEKVALPKHEKVVIKNAPQVSAVSADAHPLLKAFRDNFGAIEYAQQEIASALESRFKNSGLDSNPLSVAVDLPIARKPEAAMAMQPFEKPMELSLRTFPDLVDHAMYYQKEGWKHMEDIFPVVPMTMLIQLMAELVLENVPDKKILKIENVQAFKWTMVAEPIHLTAKGEWKSSNQIHVTLGDYARADITIGDGYGQLVFATIKDLGAAMQPAIEESDIYTEKYMFHGPAYQGIKKFIEMGDRGMRATIATSTGKGSLLDNAGQLFGLWCHLAIPEDHVAFPIKINEIRFYDDIMDQSGDMECTCQLQSLDEDFPICNMVLNRNGKTWATITGWQNRRLGFNKRLWGVSRKVMLNMLSEEELPGVFVFKDEYRRSTAWDFVNKRYLNKLEKDVLETLPLPKRKSWLMGRVAVKDAVRDLIFKEKGVKLFPAEITVKSNDVGKPFVVGEGTELGNIKVSLAHKDKQAVATATYNEDPGIDIEEIKDRGEGFLNLSFYDEEMALIPAGEDKWEWATRFWTAKEAYGKSLGVGLHGNPKNYKVEEVRGEELRIKDKWIKSTLNNNYIIGWTQ